MDTKSSNCYLDIVHEFGKSMIGPSSSHTLGPALLGKAARDRLGEKPSRAEITLFNSFVDVGYGHGTRQALVAGLLGEEPTSPIVAIANDNYAKGQGLTIDWHLSRDPDLHPNSVAMTLIGEKHSETFWGCSLGGGRIHLDVNPEGCARNNLSNSFTPITFAAILDDIKENHLHSISDWLIKHQMDLPPRNGHVCTKEELLKEMANRSETIGKAMHNGQIQPLKPRVPLWDHPYGLACALARGPHRKDSLGELGDPVAGALALSEGNLADNVIVALPTGGACGVVGPTIQDVTRRMRLAPNSEQVLRGWLAAFAIQAVIVTNASVSGATHGCQAEIGSAAAMAAGAAAEIITSEPRHVVQAVAMTLQYFLGLVCDPIAGLVDTPCMYRNAPTPLVALTYAWMAVEGIEFPVPADEVIQAMATIGNTMPPELKETARGGLAATPTGEQLMQEISRRQDSEFRNG